MNPPSSSGQCADWLRVSGPRELEQLFRAIIYYPSAPILIIDNDRNHRDASSGAGKLLGLPREKIIGRRLDDFTEPSFRPQISQLWRAFLEQGEQEGTLRLVGPDGSLRDIEYTAKGSVLPARHVLVLKDKTTNGLTEEIVGIGRNPVPSWVQDYALFLLDPDGRVAAWYSGAEVSIT